MTKLKGVNTLTIILSWVAGYCDATTFVAGNEIFSAHVTGNFITFGAQIVKGADTDNWVKLITFPVFVLAVIAGGYISTKAKNNYRILFLEAIFLIVGAVTYLLLSVSENKVDNFGLYTVVLLTVFALGLQNAFGKLAAKDTHGPTTMMTGNVTQAALDLGGLIFKKLEAKKVHLSGLKKQALTIGGFLIGCIMGACFGNLWGLLAIGLPGVVLLVSYILGERETSSL